MAASTSRSSLLRRSQRRAAVGSRPYDRADNFVQLLVRERQSHPPGPAESGPSDPGTPPAASAAGMRRCSVRRYSNHGQPRSDSQLITTVLQDLQSVPCKADSPLHVEAGCCELTPKAISLSGRRVTLPVAWRNCVGLASVFEPNPRRQASSVPRQLQSALAKSEWEGSLRRPAP